MRQYFWWALQMITWRVKETAISVDLWARIKYAVSMQDLITKQNPDFKKSEKIE